MKVAAGRNVLTPPLQNRRSPQHDAATSRERDEREVSGKEEAVGGGVGGGQNPVRIGSSNSKAEVQMSGAEPQSLASSARRWALKSALS